MPAAPLQPDSDAHNDSGDPMLERLADVDSAGIQQTLLALLANSPALEGAAASPIASEDKLVLIGTAPRALTGTRYATLAGCPPDASTSPERKDPLLGAALQRLLYAGALSEAHVLSGRGLLETIASLLLRSSRPLGAKVDVSAFGVTRFDALFFGYSGRCAVAVAPAQRIGTVLSETHTSGVAGAVIGELYGSEELMLLGKGIAARWTLQALRAAQTSAPSTGPA